MPPKSESLNCRRYRSTKNIQARKHLKQKKLSDEKTFENYAKKMQETHFFD